MKHKRELAPLIAIAVILLGLSIGSFLAPDVAFSANENRYLQLMPEFSLKKLMSGDFTKKMEDYTSDQIVLRDFWTGSRSIMQRAMGYQDIGGVWLGEDGYYFSKMTEDTFDRENYEKNLSHVEDFFAANSDKDCRILLAPTPGSVMFDELPYGAAMYNEIFYDDYACYEQLSDTFGDQAILTQAALRHRAAEEQVYYRTDHHWTAQGAYVAYRCWCDSTDHEKKEYPLTAVSDSFRGTLYSKVLLPDSVYDTVSIAEDVTIRSMDCDGTVRDSIYDLSTLQEKDHYKVYMGGNHAKAVIDTGADTGRTLLVVKDSFANSFIPYLAAEYDTITVVDLRYCREKMQDLADDCSDILVLYEMTNFASDSNLFKLNRK